MYEIIVSTEFEVWFKALEPGLAEHVATALDVLESAGPALDPSKASRFLLWYDGTIGRPASDAWAARMVRLHGAAESMRRLTLWQKEVVRSLESPTFRARLARLDRGSAERTFAAIERVKERIRVGKMRVNLLEKHDEVPPFTDSVQRGLFEVLSLAGVEPGEVADDSSGLRELTIEETAPRIRLLYGIDVPRKKILAIVGEPLDRAFYGDSVRLAERRWRDYMADATVHEGWHP